MENLSDRELTAVFLTATKVKSVLLGLSILSGKSADDIINAAFLEDLYQNEIWGFDTEAIEKRKQIKEEIILIKDWIK